MALGFDIKTPMKQQAEAMPVYFAIRKQNSLALSHAQ
jgi:hypothetical protein